MIVRCFSDAPACPKSVASFALPAQRAVAKPAEDVFATDLELHSLARAKYCRCWQAVVCRGVRRMRPIRLRRSDAAPSFVCHREIIPRKVCSGSILRHLYVPRWHLAQQPHVTRCQSTNCPLALPQGDKIAAWRLDQDACLALPNLFTTTYRWQSSRRPSASRGITPRSPSNSPPLRQPYHLCFPQVCQL